MGSGVAGPLALGGLASGGPCLGTRADLQHVSPVCVESGLSPSPRELKIPTAREEAAATD